MHNNLYNIFHNSWVNEFLLFLFRPISNIILLFTINSKGKKKIQLYNKFYFNNWCTTKIVVMIYVRLQIVPNMIVTLFFQSISWQLKKQFKCNFSHMTLLIGHITFLNNTYEQFYKSPHNKLKMIMPNLFKAKFYSKIYITSIISYHTNYEK